MLRREQGEFQTGYQAKLFFFEKNHGIKNFCD